MSTFSLLLEKWQRLKSSDSGRRVLRALSWGGLAAITGRGLPLLSMMLVARVLGPNEFGKLTLLYSTALAFEVLGTAGLAVTCTKFIADLHRRDAVRTGQVIDLGNVVVVLSATAIGGVLAVAAPWIAERVLVAPDVMDLVFLCAIFVPILSLSAIQQGILLGFESFRSVATIELISGIVFVAVVPVGGLLHGIGGAFVLLLVGYALRLALLMVAATREARRYNVVRRWVVPVQETHLLWNFGLPTMLNSLLWGPVMWCAMTIVAHEHNGHVEVGVFNAANQWLSVLLFLPTVMNQAAFPILTERLAAGAEATTWRLFYAKMMVTLAVLSAAVTVILIFSPFIMKLYGKDFSGREDILVVVAIAAWLAAPQGPLGNMLIAYGRPWAWVYASLVWASVLIFTVFSWRQHGALALAAGCLVAYAARGLYAGLRVYQLWASRPRSAF